MGSMTEMAYAEDAYRAEAIPLLPAPQKARKRAGEALLPFGDYAGIDPNHQLSEDAELVQYQEAQDPGFYQSQGW